MWGAYDSRMQRFIWLWIIRPFLALVFSRALLEICHALEFYPDKLIADLVLNAASQRWLTAIGWILVAATAALIFWSDELRRRKHDVSEHCEATENTERPDHWTERKQLEIYVIANAASGTNPNALPVVDDPQLTRLRELKDAITLGELDATINGARPNVWSTVSLQSFEQYVAATNKPYWMEILQRWQERQSSSTSRISLLDLAGEAEDKNWRTLDPESLHILDFFDGIRQLGVDGTVGIYGRPVHSFQELTQNEPLIRIPQDHWRSHEIDLISFFQWKHSKQCDYADDNYQTRVKGLVPGQGESFADIYFDRAGALAWLQTDALAFRGRREKRGSLT